MQQCHNLAISQVFCCLCCPLLFQRGKGVEVNYRLSLEFYRRAADLGDPEAQGAMAMRVAYGLHHPNSFDGASLRHFGRVGAMLWPHGVHSWQRDNFMQQMQQQKQLT